MGPAWGLPWDPLGTLWDSLETPWDPEEAPRKTFWEALGLPWDRLGPTWDFCSDRFDIILGSCGDLWGSSGSHFFDYSEFGSRAETPIIRTPLRVETYAEIEFFNHGS